MQDSTDVLNAFTQLAIALVGSRKSIPKHTKIHVLQQSPKVSWASEGPSGKRLRILQIILPQPEPESLFNSQP